MKIYICKTCGHISFNEAPDSCPVCGAPKESFVRNDNIFKDSKEKSPEADIKHIPTILVVKKCGLIPEETCTDVNVRVGKVLHPMTEGHLITFVDCYIDLVYAGRAMFSANSINPAAAFHLKTTSGKVTIVENCNLHGYWMAEEKL